MLAKKILLFLYLKEIFQMKTYEVKNQGLNQPVYSES